MQIVLMDSFPSDPGFASCPLGFRSPFIFRLCTLLVQAQTLHIILDAVPPSLPWTIPFVPPTFVIISQSTSSLHSLSPIHLNFKHVNDNWEFRTKQPTMKKWHYNFQCMTSQRQTWYSERCLIKSIQSIQKQNFVQPESWLWLIKNTLYFWKTMLIFRNYMIFFQTFDNFISYNLFKYFTYVHS